MDVYFDDEFDRDFIHQLDKGTNEVKTDDDNDWLTVVTTMILRNRCRDSDDNIYNGYGGYDGGLLLSWQKIRRESLTNDEQAFSNHRYHAQ